MCSSGGAGAVEALSSALDALAAEDLAPLFGPALLGGVAPESGG